MVFWLIPSDVQPTKTYKRENLFINGQDMQENWY